MEVALNNDRIPRMAEGHRSINCRCPARCAVLGRRAAGVNPLGIVALFSVASLMGIGSPITVESAGHDKSKEPAGLSRGEVIAPPAHLHAQWMGGCRVCLTWEAPAGGDYTCDIERQMDDGPFSVIRVTAPGSRLCHDLATVPDRRYGYRIRARHGDEFSDYSDKVVVIPPPLMRGSLVAWGSDSAGQIGGMPRGEDFVAVGAGNRHSIALRADGTILVWGGNDDGQISAAPAGGGFVQIDAGGDHCLALRTDGSIAAWGLNNNGQTSGAPTGTGYVKVSAGGFFSMALRGDGTPVLWGDGRYGQLAEPGDLLRDVDSGTAGTTAVRSDGSLVYWGLSKYGQHRVPAGTDFLRVIGGESMSIGIRNNGTFVPWGADSYFTALSLVVTAAPGSGGIVSVAEGYSVGIAIRTDGSLLSWGRTDNGLVAGTPPGNGFLAVAIGDQHAVAIRTPIHSSVQAFSNGGFESPESPPGTVLLSGGVDHRRLGRWTASGGPAAVITTGQFLGLEPGEGSAWVEFNADDSPVGGSLSQTFSTLVGRRYTARYTAGKSGRGQGTVGLLGEILSESGRVLSTANHLISNPGWGPAATLHFTAESPDTTIRFTDISPETWSTNAALDGVSVGLDSADDPAF